MKKVLIFLLVLILLVVGGALAVGFLADPSFNYRKEFVIDVPPAKVWEVVGDNKRTKDWLPKDDGGGVTETRPNSPKEGQHIYVQGDGTTMTMEVVAREDGKKYLERVVASTSGMEKMFPEMTWGWEVADGGNGKTKLTSIMYGKAAKPLGTLMNRVMTATGGYDKFTKNMTENISSVAQGGKAIH